MAFKIEGKEMYPIFVFAMFCSLVHFQVVRLGAHAHSKQRKTHSHTNSAVSRQVYAHAHKRAGRHFTGGRKNLPWKSPFALKLTFLVKSEWGLKTLVNLFYTVEFVYNGFVCNVNLPITLHFLRSWWHLSHALHFNSLIMSIGQYCSLCNPLEVALWANSVVTLLVNSRGWSSLRVVFSQTRNVAAGVTNVVPAGIGVAKGSWPQISIISCRFVLWQALFLTKYGCSLKVKNIWAQKFSGWLRYYPRAYLKNNISMISVFTLRSTLIVNSKIIKGKLSNILISDVCITLVALRMNPHARSSSQLQEGWWSLLHGNCLYWCKYTRDFDGAT